MSTDRSVPARPALILFALAGGLAHSLCLLFSAAHTPSALLSLSAAALTLQAFSGRFTSRPLMKMFAQGTSLLVAMLFVALMTADSFALGSSLVWVAVMTPGLAAFSLVRTHLQQVESTKSTIETNSALSPTANLSAPIAVEAEFDTALTARLELLAFVAADETDLESEEFEEEEFEMEEAADDRVVTAWTRRRQRDEERLDGSISVEFAPGQKQVYVHIPFMPGFQCRPQAYCVCEFDAVFSAEFDILHTYGGRMNVRRRGNTVEPAEADVTISIIAPLTTARAA